MPIAPISEIFEELRAGKMVILVDDPDRENEGDLVLAAEKATPEAVNFMIRHGSGIVCLSMTNEKADALHLPLQVATNSSRFGTQFTVTIEARHGVTTGVSAADRATTAGPRTSRDPGTSTRSARRREGCSGARGRRRGPPTSAA